MAADQLFTNDETEMFSKVVALAEKAGKHVKLLVVPATDTEAWAEALARVLCDPELQKSLAERGPAHAARYSWHETAKRTLTVYREVAAAGK